MSWLGLVDAFGRECGGVRWRAYIFLTVFASHLPLGQVVHPASRKRHHCGSSLSVYIAPECSCASKARLVSDFVPSQRHVCCFDAVQCAGQLAARICGSSRIGSMGGMGRHGAEYLLDATSNTNGTRVAKSSASEISPAISCASRMSPKLPWPVCHR